MLTPSFDVSQDDEFIIITLRVPYVKISDADIFFEGHEFRFYCKPYFLHLHFPGELASDGSEKSTYDIESGSVLIHLPKNTKGQFFPNLGMLTTLLPKKPNKSVVQPKVEVLDGGYEGGGTVETGSNEDDEEWDWSVEQDVASIEEPKLLPGLQPYGFTRKHHGVFLKLQEACSVLLDCPDPDHMTSHERRLARIAHEEASFSQDHYLADLMDNDYITVLLDYEPPWKSRLNKWKTSLCENDGRVFDKEPGPDIVPFSSTQRDQLKSLPNREYLLDKATKRSLYLGLIDIIFSYAYQHRTTEGEDNVEASWTICRLSPTLCWLEEFHGSVHEVIHTSVRRALCYPLYRHWRLAMAVLQDTRDLFTLGRRQLLSCVLETIAAMKTCDPYYLLNDVYLTDYAIWLQTASVKQIQRLAEELNEVKLEPKSIGWELEELEEAALLAVAEQQEGGGARSAALQILVEEQERGGAGSASLQALVEQEGGGAGSVEHQTLVTQQEGGGAGSAVNIGTEDSLQTLTHQMQHLQLTDMSKRPLIEEIDSSSSTSTCESEDEISSESSSSETETDSSKTNSASSFTTESKV